MAMVATDAALVRAYFEARDRHIRQWRLQGGRWEPYGGAVPVEPLQAAALVHPDARVRRDALGVLDHAASDASTATFRAALGDPVPRVRIVALHGLSCERCRVGAIGVADVVGDVLRVLREDPSPKVRHAAIDVLARFVSRDGRIVEGLWDVAAVDDDELVRTAAAGAARGERRAWSRKAVRRRTADADAAVRRSFTPSSPAVGTFARMVSTLADIRVERDEDGVLLVAWSGAAPVDIGVGATPVASEHTIVATAVEGGPVRLDRNAPRRAYVSLVPAGGAAVVVAERRVPFAGITNLRDLGGYPTADGGTTRWGCVFRADALHKLTTDDLDAFHELGVRTVYDLRGDVERAEFPGPVPSVHLSIVGRPRDVEPPPPPPEMTERDGEELLRDTYVGALTHSAGEIGSVVRGLADPDLTPAVFHCHGGKDRTGLVAAVLLLALGVDRDTVLDDYEATSLYRFPEDQHDSLANMLQAGISPEAAAGVLGTPRWAMAEAVDVLLGSPGGVEGFLTGPAGLDAAELAALRDHLVTRRLST